MLTRLKEKEEEIHRILECLAEESAKGTPIIVEGKKDIQTLRALGVQGKIISTKTGGKSFLDVIYEVEKLQLTKVILLLDFDRRGKEWTKRLTQHLEKTGIKSDTSFWKTLHRLVGKDIRDIEGIATYIETLKKKTCNAHEN